MTTIPRWGTWEELVLGGAVLRHGTAAWSAVAAELRSRTLLPDRFTPKACQAKYEDIQERYSGCQTWFEELRKQRLVELRRELEKSEDTIGSLQSKLESLQTESSGYNTSQTESPLCIGKTDDHASSSKEASRSESSAGSYMGDTGREEHGISPSISSQENNKMEDTQDNSGKVICRTFDIVQGIVRKKRGQRKRKDCTIVKEGSVEESSLVAIDRKDPLLGCDQDAGVPLPQKDVGEPQEELIVSCDTNRPPSETSDGSFQSKHSSSFLTAIMDSISDQKAVSIFARRLETQKRASYKKMIRQHVDLRTVNLRIKDGSITSAKELFRDLLLLATNAIVFFAKSSPEHKSAIILRRLVSQALQEHECTPISSDGSNVLPAEVVESKAIEPHSLQPCSTKVPESVVATERVPGSLLSENGKQKVCNKEVPAESLSRKRVIGSKGVKRGLVNCMRGRENTERGRKRARKR